MRATRSLSPSYFEDMFAANSDPWGFETSAYERAKFAHTISALGERRYSHALEIGCAQGVLTRLLASHTDSLLSIDVSEHALANARRRSVDIPQVKFNRMVYPAEAPPFDAFELIVLSEVVYYWDDADLTLAAHQLLKSLTPGGDIILVHWTGDTDYPKSGDDAVDSLLVQLKENVEIVVAERTSQYRLDLWRRRQH